MQLPLSTKPVSATRGSSSSGELAYSHPKVILPSAPAIRPSGDSEPLFPLVRWVVPLVPGQAGSQLSRLGCIFGDGTRHQPSLVMELMHGDDGHCNPASPWEPWVPHNCLGQSPPWPEDPWRPSRRRERQEPGGEGGLHLLPILGSGLLGCSFSVWLFCRAWTQRKQCCGPSRSSHGKPTTFQLLWSTSFQRAGLLSGHLRLLKPWATQGTGPGPG